jgi:predicted amidohydrolase YtcJ
MPIYYNANIITQNKQQPIAEAMAVKDGTIVGVGTHNDMMQLLPHDDASINLQGKTILPGFNDAHIHIWKVGSLLGYVLDVRGITTKKLLLQKLTDFAAQQPGNGWIQARGFNEAFFEDQQMPTRQELDEAIPHRPCFLLRTCAHIAILNTAALTACGITAATPVPTGGEIRLGINGSPNGIITETALGIAQQQIPPYTAADYKQMILLAQDALLQAGITSATDPAVMPDLLEVYLQMDAAKELKIRVNAIPIMLPDGSNTALPLPKKYQSDYLQVNTVKFFADGGLSGQTAALLHHPYKNSHSKGVLRLTKKFFQPLALHAQEAGFAIATHAIGDAAIEMVLNVYEAMAVNNKQNIQHRIEHLGLPTTQHLQTMKQLNVMAVSQPGFLYELGTNFNAYLPDAYLRQVYPYRSVLKAGVSLAFSSDAPVIKDFTPLRGIQTALDRKDNSGTIIAPTEVLLLAEALSAYTLGGALADGQLHKKGSIEIGKLADFVVLKNNILTAPIEHIASLTIEQTVVNGKIAFEKR